MTKINRFREHRFFISIIHRTLSVAVVALACSFGMASSGFSQDIQDRTIRWGHLLNPDHPLSKGVQKFTEIVAARAVWSCTESDVLIPGSWGREQRGSL